MKWVTQGSFRTNKNNRDKRQVVVPVLELLAGLLSTFIVLAGASFLPGRDHPTDAGVPAVAADLPPYWGWLEGDASNTSQSREAGRVVYAYSVIPGGVKNSKELQLALAHDAVAASHYSGFHAELARPLRLHRVRRVYVSYRIGNRIYWTSKKVTLRVGETLLSDGANLVRGGCGNRISEAPLQPSAPSEPAEPALNAPIVRRDPVETTDLPAPPPIWTENPSPFVLALAPIFGSPAQGSTPFIPPLGFAPCCGGGDRPKTPRLPPVPAVPPGPPTSPPPTEPSQPPSPPPVSTPEPQTLVLLIVGLASAVMLVKFRRH
jgi:hypothetical protein